MNTERSSRRDDAHSLPAKRPPARALRASGRVAWMTDGYGFVEGTDGEQYYFDRSSVDEPRYKDLGIGTLVEFLVRRAGGKRQATHITRCRKSSG